MCGRPLSAEAAEASNPRTPQRRISRRVALGALAAGAATTLGGAAYLTYALTSTRQFSPRPPILTYTGHDFARAAAWSPDGTRIASTGWPNGGNADSSAVHIWDATTGKRLLVCALESTAIGLTPAGVVWSSDGAQVLAAVVRSSSSDIESVRVWDAATGQRVRRIPAPPTATTWAMNERYVAMVTQATRRQGTAQMSAWLLPTPTLPATPAPTPSPPGRSTPMPPATSTSAPPTPNPVPPAVIEIWELTTGSSIATLDPPAPPTYGAIEQMVWAPEGSKLAISVSPVGPAPSQAAWQIWDASARKELQTFGIPSQEYEVVAWSRDGKSLALGTTVADVATGRRTATYTAEGYLYAQAWAPDGKHIAAWDRTGTGLYATKYDAISIIDTSSGRRIATYNGGKTETAVTPPGGQPLMAWSPDGKRLLVVRQSVEVWALGQG